MINSFVPEFGPHELNDGENFLFTFIVNRSLSMEICDRISTAVNALTLFLRSLPLKSKFAIISFGSKHQFLEIDNEIIFENSFKTMRKAIECISLFKSDFGSENILEPLKAA